MTDVPYQMTVGVAFVSNVKTWDRGHVNDEQLSVITRFSPWTQTIAL